MNTRGDRQIIVINGSAADCLKHAQEITQNLDCLLLDDPKKAGSFLGQEFDSVIFPCSANSLGGGGCTSTPLSNHVLDPNAFGAITGTIRGGGYLILCKPEGEDKNENQDGLNNSLFQKRFWKVLNKAQHQSINAFDKPILLKTLEKSNTTNSTDQDTAIDKIIHVVKGHRRRPLVITADRGRGKSAALGIAAAQIFAAAYKNIIICAPSKKTAKVIFKHALENNPKCRLSFYSPDELQQQKPQADLVLIDEAAAIPVPLLRGFLTHYSRIVFSSTQHGYEGSGQGFAIRFKKILDNIAPAWVSCPLHTPIRWCENDTLEKFVFDALLLNAEPSKVSKNIKPQDCTINKLDKSKLIKDNRLLIEIFGLLVNAHYQTKPSDLKQMLDDDTISIHITQYNNQVIAVALLMQEGGIDNKTAKTIFAGTRRLQGHLVAQSLAANVGIEQAPCLRGERISRIAVHPNLQQQGFGSDLLNTLIQQSKADYLSSSFGATIALLTFWETLEFTPVYFGMKRDASSGTHSAIMLHAKNKTGKDLLNDAQQRFSKNFPHLLSDPFRTLEPELTIKLLQPQSPSVDLSPYKNELAAFANKQRGYENTLYPIWHLVRNAELHKHSNKLNTDEVKIIIMKVLQKHSWESTRQNWGGDLQGKKEALLLLRHAISKLLLN